MWKIIQISHESFPEMKKREMKTKEPEAYYFLQRNFFYTLD